MGSGLSTVGDEEVPRMVYASDGTWADFVISQNPKRMLPNNRKLHYARLCGLPAHVPSRVDGLHPNANLVPVSIFGPHLDTLILLFYNLTS